MNGALVYLDLLEGFQFPVQLAAQDEVVELLLAR